jgi:hypothetical protein
MMLLLTALLIAALAATVVSLVVYSLPFGPLHQWIRRLALLVFNLAPGAIGTWRSSFTPRETAFVTWFLVFVATLVLLVFVAPRVWHSHGAF